jgi:gag-polypeptide of LTR copia-type
MARAYGNLSPFAIRYEHPVPFSHQIHTVLNQDNYLLWKSQVLPVLEGYDLLHFIDGSYDIPPCTITTDGVVMLNPAFSK